MDIRPGNRPPARPDTRPPQRIVERPSTTPPQPQSVPAPALPDTTLPLPAPIVEPSQPQAVQPDAPVAVPPVIPPEAPKQRKSVIKRLIVAAVILIGIVLIAVAALVLWYQSQLTAVQADSQDLIPVTIESGASPDQIARTLKDNGLIRNETAFLVHIRLQGIRDQLLAGIYRLSPKDSTPTIAEHLTKGQVDEFSLTFFPGATLTDTTDTPDDRKTDVTSVLRRAGYDQAEITTALSATYDHPLFATKPSGTDLEGYVYGETYRFASGSTVENILQKIFDEYYAVVQANDLVAGFARQGLSLYEGITLASIIQRESGGGDEAQIAQVFLLRRSTGMVLGSDVTYQYIADKTGVTRDINLDSPYNTRRYPGLPPGPIAAPGLKALQAVANPAAGDYLFFLSGDDDVTYYGRTVEEHEANIRDHCQIKCQII